MNISLNFCSYNLCVGSFTAGIRPSVRAFASVSLFHCLFRAFFKAFFSFYFEHLSGPLLLFLFIMDKMIFFFLCLIINWSGGEQGIWEDESVRLYALTWVFTIP